MTKPHANLAELETHADQIRAELGVQRQNEVFRLAVEAGYLVAIADRTFDATERATLVRAVEILSKDAVLEWETETLIDECVARAKSDGAAKRAAAVGEELRTLGQAEAGVLIAAAVARATKRIDKKEAAVLNAVGVAAGLTKEQAQAITKKASFTG